MSGVGEMEMRILRPDFSGRIKVDFQGARLPDDIVFFEDDVLHPAAAEWDSERHDQGRPRRAVGHWPRPGVKGESSISTIERAVGGRSAGSLQNRVSFERVIYAGGFHRDQLPIVLQGGSEKLQRRANIDSQVRVVKTTIVGKRQVATNSMCTKYGSKWECWPITCSTSYESFTWRVTSQTGVGAANSQVVNVATLVSCYSRYW